MLANMIQLATDEQGRVVDNALANRAIVELAGMCQVAPGYGKLGGVK
jgi:hypothetical protein